MNWLWTEEMCCLWLEAILWRVRLLPFVQSSQWDVFVLSSETWWVVEPGNLQAMVDRLVEPISQGVDVGRGYYEHSSTDLLLYMLWC